MKLDHEARITVQEAVEAESTGGESLGPDAERSELLYQVSRKVLSAGSAEELQELALTLVFECLKAERGALLLRNDAGELEARMLRDRKSGEITEQDLKVPRSIVEEAVADQVGILTTDAVSDARFSARSSIQQGQIRSALCAPLWDGERVLGVLYLDSRIRTYAFTRADLLLLSAIANLVAIGLRQEALHAELTEERVLRSNLQRYHSPEVVDEILTRVRGPGRSTLGLEEREVTVLFADLKGFTSLAETIDPAIVANFLNEYYELATSIVFEHGGTVNEYIGDSVMAIFGAPVSHANHARRAVETSVALLRRIREPQGSRPQLSGVEVRIALNSGRVVVGSVGSRERLKYAVIGDAVNVAARLERMGEPNTITLGEETYKRLDGSTACEDLGPMHLRGREKPLRVYRLRP